MALSINNTKGLMESLDSNARIIIEGVGSEPKETKRSKHSPTCSVEGCENPYRARGLCVTHYNQWRRENTNIPNCSIPGCDKKSHSEGMCPSHLFARNNYGDPNARNSLDDVSEFCIYADDHGKCGRSTDGGGRSLCRNHYQKLYRIQKSIDNGKKVSDEKRDLLNNFWTHKVTNRSRRMSS